MNRKLKLLAVLLIFALCLCVLPEEQALALRGEELATGPSASPAVEPAGEGEPSPEDGVEPAVEPEAEEMALPEAEESLPETEEPVSNRRGEKLFAPRGSTVYNDGGTVYNNGGTVYNNEGTVYNNGGTVYNNEGIVYNNGGTVYNNGGGTVYGNGGLVYNSEARVLPGSDSAPPEDSGSVPPEDSGAPQEDSGSADTAQVLFAEDYGALIEPEGLERDGDGYFLPLGESCTLRPAAGVSIVSAGAEGCLLEAQEDGSYLLSQPEGSVLVTLELKTDAPAFSLLPGTYNGTQYLELTGPEGAELYFTAGGSDSDPSRDRYTGPIAIREGTVIKAAARLKGALPSDTVESEYAIVSIKGPVFETEKVGYVSQAQPVTVSNKGETEAKVTGVSLSGENAASFHLNHSSGKVIPAGTSVEDYWAVQPLETLQPGTYTASVVVSLEGGETADLAFSFTVEAAG